MLLLQKGIYWILLAIFLKQIWNIVQIRIYEKDVPQNPYFESDSDLLKPESINLTSQNNSDTILQNSKTNNTNNDNDNYKYGQMFQMATYYEPKDKFQPKITKILKESYGMTRVSRRSQADFIICNKCRKPHYKFKKNSMKTALINDQQLNSKAFLTYNLRKYDSVQKKYKHFNSQYFYPRTYFIQMYFNKNDRHFLTQTTSDEISILSKEMKGIWILKKSNSLQGLGIRVIHDIKAFQNTLRLKQQGIKDPDFSFKGLGDGKYILQKYIENPMLIGGSKFDLRTFIAVINSDPVIATYYMGYFTPTDFKFDLNSKDKSVHILNRALLVDHLQSQKHIQEDGEYKDVIFGEKDFFKYMKKQDPNFDKKVYSKLQYRLKAASAYCIESVLPSIQQHKGDIQIFAVDVVLDTDYIPHIVEINSNPNLVFSSRLAMKIMPPMLRNWLELSFHLRAMRKNQIIEESRNDSKFFCKFVNMKNCHPLINQASNYSYLDELNLNKQYFQKPQRYVHEGK